MWNLKTMISNLLTARKISYKMSPKEIQNILLHQYNCLVGIRILSIIIEDLKIEDNELINDVQQYSEQFYEGFGI